jgi:CRISPR-associated protein Cmr3
MSVFQEQFLTVTPLDSLMFRDGKPFSIKMHSAKSIFPPFSYTFAGLLRTHFAKQYNFDFQKMLEAGLGDNTTFGDFSLTGSYLKKDNEVFFHVPSDLLHKKQDFKVFDVLKPRGADNKSDVVSGFPSGLAPLYSVKESDEKESFSSGFISSADMANYLQGNIGNIKVLSKDDFVLEEPRTSVKISPKTASGEKGMLFTAQLLRFKENVEFIVSFKGPSFGANAEVASFGGEKRMVKLSKSEKITLPSANINSNRIKIVLTSPAFFENMQTPNLNIEGLKLISAVSNGYENIGGWDIVKCYPKPMRKAVKAGSVYYYEIQDQNVISKLQNIESVSCIDAQAGLGKYLIGGW